MTTTTQALNTRGQHNSTNEEKKLMNSSNQHANDDNDDSDAISIRTDSTTVPAANPPRRVTVKACHRRLCTRVVAVRINGVLTIFTFWLNRYHFTERSWLIVSESWWNV
jgi:hypothetical protein